jgi:hypothetical protein
MGFFDLFKSAEVRKAERFEKIRKKIAISEQKSMMHEMILMSPHDSSLMDINPNGIGKFGLEKTNPIPVYGVDNIPAYLDKIRYKYVSEKSGNIVYNPVEYIRTTESDDSKNGSPKPTGSLIAAGASSENIKGVIDVYNLYSVGNQKLGKIYINSYSLKTSNKIPEGFFHRDEIPAMQDGRVLMELVKEIKS